MSRKTRGWEGDIKIDVKEIGGSVRSWVISIRVRGHLERSYECDIELQGSGVS